MSELLVPRSDLLEKIKPFYNDLDLIKVLTGMRRTGKSTLFELIRQIFQILYTLKTTIS